MGGTSNLHKCDGTICLGLHKLRVLSIYPSSLSWTLPDLQEEAITPEVFFAMAMLPELSTLVVGLYNHFRVSGWELEGFLDDVRPRLNASRHAKGLAPLSLSRGSPPRMNAAC